MKEKVLTKIQCPFCKKNVIVKEVKETIQEPIKGIYQKTITIEKDKQQILGE